jgi:hypothetical protein
MLGNGSGTCTLSAECSRLEKAFYALSNNAFNTSPQLPDTSQLPPTPSLAPSDVLQTLQHLLNSFEKSSASANEWNPTSWSQELKRVLATILATLDVLQDGGQVPPVTAFEPLAKPTFWPAQWLWPLGDLSNIITGPKCGKIIGYLQQVEEREGEREGEAEATNVKTQGTLAMLHGAVYGTSELVSSKMYSDLMRIVISSLEKERWDHHQPHPYKASRCSSGLHFWCSEMRSLRRKALDASASAWSREIHEKWMSDWIHWSARDLVCWYVEIIANVSRARSQQFDVDVTMLVLELYSGMGAKINIGVGVGIGSVSNSANEHATTASETKDDDNGTASGATVTSMNLFDLHRPFVEFTLSRLLVMLAIVRAPMPLVLAFVHRTPTDDGILSVVPSERTDVLSLLSGKEPLSAFLASFATAAKNKFSKKTSEITQTSPMADVVNVFAGGDGKNEDETYRINQLNDIPRPWEQLLVHGILPRRIILECAYKRHELSDAWIYPPLTEEEESGRDVLVTKLDEMLKEIGYMDEQVMSLPIIDPRVP